MKNNILIIFGFSGSGKSTMVNLIGKKFGLRVIHPSGILRKLLEKKPINLKETQYNKGFWESKKGIKLFKERLKEEKPLDILSDKILLKEIAKGNVAIDSWSLPWLTDKGIRIYLKTNLGVRAKRVAKRSKISYERALKTIKMKDEETRKLFERVYGFDIKKEHSVFNYIINTNKLEKKQVFNQICDLLI